jgi:type II secretory pathway component GspD/PulD (secretin)
VYFCSNSKQDIPGAVVMEFTVGTIDKNGEKTVHSRPKIIARENEEAKIEIGDSTTGKEQLSLSIIANTIKE